MAQTAQAIERIRDVIGERITTADAVRAQHGRDEFWHHAALPDAVAFALSTEEVAKIVTICADTGTPIIPFGTGTSVEGHVQAVHGGITVDLSRMDAVLEVNPEDFDCTVQAGVTRKQLNSFIRDTGLWFPLDPRADASFTTTGGQTSVMPCSVVWMSRKKSMSERCSLEPAPL